MAKRTRFLRPDDPLRLTDHRRPVSRREFIAQGFRAGTATAFGVSGLSILGISRANALEPDLSDFFTLDPCTLGGDGAKVPFICFDLAGGANIAGSNVLVGGPGGQRDSLNTAGYTRLGVPPDIMPDVVNAASVSGDFTDDSLGLLFHTESAMLQGIMEKATATVGNVNGAVIPARSDNDTGNNPHNPTYGIYQVGARGRVLQLIGSNASDSGGNSMASIVPGAMVLDPEIRPTKIDRPEDASGLVDVGDLRNLLTDTDDIVRVMETVKRISDFKINLINPGRGVDPNNAANRALKERLSCEYWRAASTFETYPDPSSVDPSVDPNIVGASGIFSQAEFDGDREFRKTASVMKLVIDGLAGAGTITMGGYDYHTGDRSTGEARDLRVGRCIGACLDYARRVGKPVMIYVFSDGSVFSNGMIETINGVDKGVWTGDNSQTAASFFLVYDPISQPELLDEGPDDPLLHQQIGWMRPDASVETSATPAANNVNQLVQTVLLNYAALHGLDGASYTGSSGTVSGFDDLFPGHSMGDIDARKRYIAFKKLASVDGDGELS